MNMKKSFIGILAATIILADAAQARWLQATLTQCSQELPSEVM